MNPYISDQSLIDRFRNDMCCATLCKTPLRDAIRFAMAVQRQITSNHVIGWITEYNQMVKPYPIHELFGPDPGLNSLIHEMSDCDTMDVASAYTDSLWSGRSTRMGQSDLSNELGDLVLSEDDLADDDVIIESNEPSVPVPSSCHLCEFATASGMVCMGEPMDEHGMCIDCYDVWPLSTTIWTCGCECQACELGQYILLGHAGRVLPDAHLHTRRPSSDPIDLQRARWIEETQGTSR